MYCENEKQSHFGSMQAALPIGKSNRFTALPESWYAPHRNDGDSPYGVCQHTAAAVAAAGKQGKNIYFPLCDPHGRLAPR